MTDEDMRRGFEQVNALEGEMKAANALLFSGRLTESSRARVVRGTRGQIRTTDGPYAETKEHLEPVAGGLVRACSVRRRTTIFTELPAGRA